MCHRGISRIVAAQRLSTVRDRDSMLVMDKRAIIGRHLGRADRAERILRRAGGPAAAGYLT